MEDPRPHCAIFCTADIPPTTLDALLENTKAHKLGNANLFRDREMNTADHLVLITSKNLSSIHRGVSPPVQSFTSPFIGQSVEEVAAWFQANIAEPEVVGYAHCTFIVLESEAVEDEICTVVCTLDEPCEKLRCDFTLALQNAVILEVGQPMEDGSMGCFKRSGVVMTKENYKLAQNRGMYLDGMEVKVDEEWRDFGNW